MSERPPYRASVGTAHAMLGVGLFAIAGISARNLNEGDLFWMLLFGSLGTGLYFVIAGAVARGRQLSR